MLEDWQPWAGGIAVGAALVLAVRWVRRRAPARTVEAAWTRTAARLGLQYESAAEPRIVGRLQGHGISVRVLSGRQLDDEIPYTLFHVAYRRPLPIALRIVRRPGPPRRGDGAVEPDIVRTGDSRFDARVQVAGENTVAIVEFLTAERRRSLRRLLEILPSCRLDRQGMHCKFPGVHMDANMLERTILQMVDVARLLGPEP